MNILFETNDLTSTLFISDLKFHCRGEVLSDQVDLSVYATDASIYQIQPDVVFIPIDEDDVITAVKIAQDHKIPIIARGGGTGLAGQAIGRGMIIDFSKHLDKILSFEPTKKEITVQPGIVRDVLHNYLAEYRLHFAPDPATSSRANIGGMIANNSSGTKSILYGKTIDHVIALKILLVDGTILNLAKKSKSEYQQISGENTREGEIYRNFEKIIIKNKEEIISKFPKVMRRVGGYNLDEFVTDEDWNLSKLVVGSEGTLGIILQATINLTPLPNFKFVCLSHFDTMHAAIVAVQQIVHHQPAAVEIIDKTVIELSRKNIATKDSCQVIQGHPEAVLVVEFHGETELEAQKKAQHLAQNLQKEAIGYAHPIYPEGKAYNDILTVRKKGLGLMIGMKSQRKPVAFIEDAAIPLEYLPQYIQEVDAICNNYGVDAIKYAHASVGVIHIRPILNLRDPNDIELLKKIAEETFLLVKKYGGSWSGEHGDGLVRSPFNERFFGKEIYHAFKEVKGIFDTDNLLNPGKIIDAPPMDENLRYGKNYQDQKINSVFHFREAGSFADEVHMCSGVGECRKTLKGTMCPTYMATRDEEHSTRGRANILRLAMSGQLKDGMYSESVYQALELCLSCKACKSECPSNVDMAKLKSEVWQMKYDQFGSTLRERLVRDSIKVARLFSGPIAPLINSIQKSSLFRGILDKVVAIEKKRILPTYSNNIFTSWYYKNYQPPVEVTGKVILFADTYLNYHEPSVGISTIKLLSQIGIEVILAETGCCQRPRISNGFLHLAKKEGQQIIEKFQPFIKLDYPILVCEPSCASALQYDLPDLMDDPASANDLANRLSTVADYVLAYITKNQLKISLKDKVIFIHGHCHEKSLYNTLSIKKILESCGAVVHEIESGCCGMAGVFGYEKEHYSLSEKIGRERLFNVIDKMPTNSVLIANGFSCRHQIEHFTGRKAVFWTEVFGM